MFFSSNFVRRLIDKISCDIASKVIAEVKASKFGFAIKLDESTDLTKCSQLLVYFCFTQNDAVKTALLPSGDLVQRKKIVFSIF